MLFTVHTNNKVERTEYTANRASKEIKNIIKVDSRLCQPFEYF
jgi:hypothetical protein